MECKLLSRVPGKPPGWMKRGLKKDSMLRKQLWEVAEKSVAVEMKLSKVRDCAIVLLGGPEYNHTRGVWPMEEVK